MIPQPKGKNRNRKPPKISRVGDRLWFPSNGGHNGRWNICSCCCPNKEKLKKYNRNKKKFGYDRKHKKRKNLKNFIY